MATGGDDLRENNESLRYADGLADGLADALDNIDEVISQPRRDPRSQLPSGLEASHINNEGVAARVESLEVAQDRSNTALARRLQSAEDKLRDVSDRQRRLENKIPPTTGTNGTLRWVISPHRINTADPHLALYSKKFRFQDGLETWTFQLKLTPHGVGVGEGTFMSLNVILIVSGFELSSECSSRMIITLRNMDSIHEPKDGRPRRPDFKAVVEPGELKKNRREKTIETFCPHTVFQPYQGYIIEGKILIEAVSESVKRGNNHCQEWLVDDDGIEPLEDTA